MYVTETVPVDTTLPFHLAKRSKKRSSTESDIEKESFKESPENKTKPKEDISESVSRSEKPVEAKNSRQKMMKDSASNQTENDREKENGRKTDEGLAREKEEIEDIAKSILDDDDYGIEEDLFALDTEVTSKKTRTSYNERQQNEGSVRGTDKSRISESQFTESVRTEKAATIDANFGRKTKDTNRVSDTQFVDTVGNSKRASIDTDLSNVGATGAEKSRMLESPYTEVTDRGSILSTDDGFMETGTRDSMKRLKDKEIANRYADMSHISEGKISGVCNERNDNEKSVKLSEKSKDSGDGWLGVTQKSMAPESQVSEVDVQKSKKRGREIIGETERDKLNMEETGMEDVFADSKDIEKQFVSNAEATMLPLGFKNAKINKVILFVNLL